MAPASPFTRARPGRGGLVPIALAVAFFAVPAFAQPRLDDVPELDGLRSRWLGAMETLAAPGLAIAIVKDGEVLALDALGRRDAEGTPVDVDTFFYIASITKTYLATAVVALADDDRLGLDAPVRDVLPRFRLADERTTDTITVRDLLDHDAGLSSGPIVFLDAYSGQIDEDRYYRWLGDVERVDGVLYSNLHYTLLGRVVEQLTGDSWKDHLADRLFEPLGLTRTTAYASRMYGDENHAVPLERVDGRWVPCRVRKTDRTMHAAGGMGTTARDAARWIRFHVLGGELDGADIASAAAVREMQTAQSAFAVPEGQIRRMEGYGLGWKRGTYRGRPYFVHGGGYVGTAAHISFLPEQRIGVALLCNAGELANALLDIVSIDVYDRLLDERDHPDLLASLEQRAASRERERPEPTDPALLAASLTRELAAYAGRFTHADWGTIAFSVDDDRLVARMGDLPIDFRPVRPDRFTAIAGGGAVTFEGAFLPSDDGTVSTVLLSDEADIIRFDRD